MSHGKQNRILYEVKSPRAQFYDYLKDMAELVLYVIDVDLKQAVGACHVNLNLFLQTNKENQDLDIRG
jgi:hypothetical protein